MVIVLGVLIGQLVKVLFLGTLRDSEVEVRMPCIPSITAHDAAPHRSSSRHSSSQPAAACDHTRCTHPCERCLIPTFI